MKKASNSLFCLSLSVFMLSISCINFLLASSLLNNSFFKLSAVVPLASSSPRSFCISALMALVCSVLCMKKASNSLSCLSLSAFMLSISCINFLLASSLLNNWFFKFSAVVPLASSSPRSFCISALMALVCSICCMRKASNSLPCLSLSVFMLSISCINTLMASSLLNSSFFKLPAVVPLASRSSRSFCISATNFLLVASLLATSMFNFWLACSLAASSDTTCASCSLASASCWIKASSSLAMRASSCSVFDNLPSISVFLSLVNLSWLLAWSKHSIRCCSFSALCVCSSSVSSLRVSYAFCKSLICVLSSFMILRSSSNSFCMEVCNLSARSAASAINLLTCASSASKASIWSLPRARS
mmetsp:Transcript_54618/g.177491  ORF Transcript_54618/g.177491 Transcript_54618/m.177491 type:complete len:360 (-) Transcript_54618:277-1356(-)